VIEGTTMRKIKNKTLLIALIGLLSAESLGCANRSNLETKEYKIEQVENFNTQKRTDDTEVEIFGEVINTEEEVEEDNTLIKSIPSVTATTNVNIRESAVDGDILGVLKSGSSLKTTNTLDNNWYEVEYYGKTGYVSGDYVVPSITYDIDSSIEKVVYATEETTLTIPDYLSESGIEEQKDINALECFEVYQEFPEYYLVKSNDNIGYIGKESLEELDGTFVVIDISDQELKLYSDNEILVDTPVVTGQPTSNSTRTGLFAIYNITYNRDLIGPNYRSYVDIMMKFDNNIGLHDAEYHVNEDGKKHGWRNKSEFGGDTYLTNGSHGCVNMLHDDVMEVSNYVDIGTKVLVKQ
jgi:hypothetical protein